MVDVAWGACVSPLWFGACCLMMPLKAMLFLLCPCKFAMVCGQGLAQGLGTHNAEPQCHCKGVHDFSS